MGFITVIGSMNMDLVVRTSRMPLAGETLAGKDFHLIPGGKGSNQAVAAARAGASTRMVGCIGADAFGPVLLDALAGTNVDISGIARMDGISTGTATILVEDSGENRIIIVPGANGLVSVDTISRQWPCIEQSDIILLQHEIPLQTIHFCIERASAAGIQVILNPAPVYPLPQELISKIDILILNEGEARVLTGIRVDDPVTAMGAAQILCDWGVQTAIITLGANGALLSTAQTAFYQPAYKVTVVDTTAAGDTFTGGYAASILTGKSPPEALQYATAASALAVTRLGAQTSIPEKDEVEAFIADHAGEPDFSTVILKKGG